jgi:uncharacterized protein (UPF0333 family)
MFIKKKSGQAILEYAIMLGVVIAALLIMQVFVKRGYEGSLKASSDKMGEQFSASSTTIQQKTEMNGNQTITDEVASGSVLDTFTNVDLQSTLNGGAYSYSDRRGGTIAQDVRTGTDRAAEEKTRWTDYANMNGNGTVNAINEEPF